MKYIKVKGEDAENARRIMLRLSLADNSRTILHSRSYVYFPIADIRGAKAIKLIDRLGNIVEKGKPEKHRNTAYAEKLKKIIKNTKGRLSKGYDLLGDIAIIEFSGNKSDAEKIAKLLMQSNKSIKTVLAKEGAVSGKYRTRKFRYIAGIKNYVANYRENGCIFKFDVRKVFFSNRLSFERSRILKLVEDNEKVMVMFAGAGPFAIEIAKHRKNSNITAIELNRDGYKYMLDNIKLNKVNNVHAVLGDVKKVYKKYTGQDRIIMPLPMSSTEFLSEAYKVGRSGSYVHLYALVDLDTGTEKLHEAIKLQAKKSGYRVDIMNSRIVRPYSAKQAEIVVDFRIEPLSRNRRI